ncbi:gephyrin-like molybdotransferase receptor GlpR [Mycobacterium sp.]|uniref:divisome protein SepX/GlpR n=1 Tax=Mycobacterium sp. TaxID=1785 RepID=UPI002BB9556F|nr:gephyrin-like molybdotransferase receptor GlpR [Mycobacterium sp.]HME48175.1 gephyrin-like molybdotransferase receptor GlpR [Mycobacterium sp.]
MPSVPQSLLWISLVVLWLFVLVPMLISKRDAVRRTSDVALATRVLNSTGARKLRRGPAAGHRSDPAWQPPDDVDDLDDDEAETAPRAVVVTGVDEAVADEEPDYLDVDVVEEDSGALPVGSSEAVEPEPEPECQPEEPVAEDLHEDEEAEEPVASEDDGTADEYEYVEDTSGLESGDEPPTTVSPSASRRRMYDSKTAAAVSARKYKFRRRMVSVMALVLIVSAAAAFTGWPQGKWLCATAGVITLLYLAYLRRQTRIEERLRRRRMQRMARSRLGVENTSDRDVDLAPSRLRRPGADVLEIDDEDPVFEHLDYTPGPMDYQLPRAAGQ